MKRSAALTLLLLLLLLSGLTHSAIIPSHVASGDYFIDEQRVINITGESQSAPSGQLSVRNLTINFSLPIGSHLTQSPAGAQALTDTYGNPYLHIFIAEPSFPYFLHVNSSLSVQSEPLNSLPSPPPFLPNPAPYLSLSPDLSPNDARVEALARQITENASSEFEKISQLAIWTHEHIQYDANLTDRLPNVSTILDQPRGVCTEYTLLFTAFARSLGYPTRFVSGYAYSSDAGAWQGHSWAEVWLGKWVPVDPTWLEVGSLDATHIALMRTPHASPETLSISALVSERSELKLEYDPGAGVLAEQVHALRLMPSPAVNSSTLQSSSDTLPPGGVALVWSIYPSSDYNLHLATLSSCAINGSPLLGITPSSHLLIMEPNQTQYAIWMAQAPVSLDANLIYHCPLSPNTNQADTSPFSLSIRDESTNHWPQLSAELESSVLEAGSRQKVFVQLPPSLAGQTVHILEQKFHQQAVADDNLSLEFDFEPQGFGPHTLYVFSASGDPVLLNYIVSAKPAPTLSLVFSNLTLVDGDTPTLLLNLTGLDSRGPGPLSLQWSLGEDSGRQVLAAASNLTLPFTLPALRAGNPFLSLRLLSPDGQVLLRNTVPLHVWPKSQIVVSSVWLQSNQKDGWRVLLQFERSGGARAAQLEIHNTRWPIGDDNTLHLILPAGRYPILLHWADPTGRPHATGGDLDIFPPPPSSSSVMPYLSNASYDLRVIPALLFLALLFAALMGAALYLKVDSLKSEAYDDSLKAADSTSPARASPSTPKSRAEEPLENEPVDPIK